MGFFNHYIEYLGSRHLRPDNCHSSCSRTCVDYSSLNFLLRLARSFRDREFDWSVEHVKYQTQLDGVTRTEFGVLGLPCSSR
jgi:hypothetical protein